MNTHRTDPVRWPFANGPSLPTPHVASMTWRDGLFAHWPVDPDDVRPHVPGQVSLETRDGRAWLSVVPFVLTDVGVRGTPSIARLAFPELNVRTYVRYRGDPGLFFFSIDVDNSFVAAAVDRTTRLPVYRANMRVGATEANHVAFKSTREQRTGDGPARFAATYRPNGEVFTADPDTLAHWLSARHRFYVPDGDDILTGEVSHDPWPLQPAAATIHENTMFEANGLPTTAGEPILYYVDELSMTGSVPRRLRGG
ncbi:YqjF family protein [Natrinema salsiterrestre]|uniref:DUF2071 domain-containing protein n=1 Tax=Natrinema salsiterrestre TaxID=2950540 RepID=A0A9Q4L765_9EURY|nr:DUF2071 domain-containing protein [Natrinema salsiterrestre]MDF9747200.1 DUF2071 domain-containing protein [Natrinema salsiterrestre]